MYGTQKWRKKPSDVWVMHFETNNESNDANMNEICLWINQGKQECGAWHNGTNIFVKIPDATDKFDHVWHKAECGDYIIKMSENNYAVFKSEIFEKSYERLI